MCLPRFFSSGCFGDYPFPFPPPPLFPLFGMLFASATRNKRPSDVSVNLPHVETALRFAIPAGREEFTSPKQIPISENRIIGGTCTCACVRACVRACVLA